MRLCIFAVIVLLLVLPLQVQAHHKEMVLGDATQASELTFPNISSGPGFITPDSPLYFLDKAYQSVRLALARQEDKAKIRAAIAGERFAELRLMMAKDNEQGINTALSELTSEMDQAAENLSIALGQGNDVQETAIEVNQKIREHRFALRSLIDQARGDLRLRLLAANESLREAKVEVEDNLPEDLLLNEIEDDLSETIEQEASLATDSARRLEHAVLRLDELASQAAEKDQLRRAEALRHAIEVKNETLRKQHERELKLREEKNLRLKELSEKKAEAALEVREKAEEAKQTIQEVNEEELELEDEFDNEEETDEITFIEE